MPAHCYRRQHPGNSRQRRRRSRRQSQPHRRSQGCGLTRERPQPEEGRIGYGARYRCHQEQCRTQTPESHRRPLRRRFLPAIVSSHGHGVPGCPICRAQLAREVVLIASKKKKAERNALRLLKLRTLKPRNSRNPAPRYPRTLIFENDNTARLAVGLPIESAGRNVVKISIRFTCGNTSFESGGSERIR